MRLAGVAVLAAVLSACTSVKVLQRDGCWVKRSELGLGRVQEEVGPCMRAPPKWADDQLTRLVQECVAQADHRWHQRAVDAWLRGRPYPAQAPQDETLRTCMQEARVGMVTENEELKRRVTELSTELSTNRTALRESSDEERAHLRSSNDRIAEWLGQAAQKPPGAATATASATSDGKATNESGANLTSGSNSGSGATVPAAPAIVVPASPAAAPPPTVTSPVAAPAPPAPTATPPAEADAPAPAVPALRSASPKPTVATAPKRSGRDRPTANRTPPGCDVPTARPLPEPQPPPEP
jgi:hypothetical protein